MPDTPVAIIVSGGGGAPQILSRQVGKPGIVEVASQCVGPEYNYLKGMKDQATIAQGHNPKPSKAKVQAAFHEVMTNEPSTVARADVSEKRKQKMRVAIALSKARKG